jgi:hypothetical protein
MRLHIIKKRGDVSPIISINKVLVLALGFMAVLEDG